MKVFLSGRKSADLLTDRLRICMASGTVLGLMDCLLFLTDNVVSGRFLGEAALSGLTIMNPLTTFIIFVSVIIPLGTTVSIAFAQGEGNIDEADKQFSQGMIVSLTFGILLSAVIGLFGKMAVSQLPISMEVAEYAGQYCMGIVLMPLFQFVNIYLYYIYLGQGYENICMISSAVRLVMNIALDFILCSIWGTFGVGMATTLSYFASVLLRLIPLFKAELSLHFCRGFDLKSLLKNSWDGLLLSADSVSPVLFATIMNIVVFKLFQDEGHIVFSVILNIENICMSLFFCLANSVQAMICQYYAEANHVNIRIVIRHVARYIILLSCVVTGLALAFSDYIPALYGVIENSSETSWAIRLYVPFVIFLGLTTLLSRYYVCIRYRLYGFGLLCFSSIILPVTCAAIGGVLWGMRGMWLGLGIGYMAAFFLNYGSTALLRKKSSEHLDPILLFDLETEKSQLRYCLRNTQEEVMHCINETHEQLDMVEGLSASRKNRIILMIEENGMDIVEKFPGETVNIEVDIICPKHVQDTFSLIIRNDHIMPDVTDQDMAVSSFREFFLTNAISLSRDTYYMLKKEETTIAYKI